ncbi:MAG: PP2C family protein-serine/threonine phosphatase, partial [Candidatus Eiseniibacteriota bacterium]
MADSSPRRTKRKAGALRDFLNLSWWMPLVALPFTLFFMFIQGAPWKQFWGFFQISLVFSVTINLGLWFTDHVIRPRLLRRFENDSRAALYVAGVNLVMSLVGAVAALLFINATLIKGFIRNARDVTLGLMWSLMFGLLFVGAALSIRFYRKSVDRAGSERELQLARRIQRSFLLSEFPLRPRIECHAENVSSKEVSGDFYDVVTPNDAEILLAIADVSGKGVPAALL